MCLKRFAWLQNKLAILVLPQLPVSCSDGSPQGSLRWAWDMAAAQAQGTEHSLLADPGMLFQPAHMPSLPCDCTPSPTWP